MAGYSRKYARLYLREAAAALLFLMAVGIGFFVYYWDPSSYRNELTITGGSASGSRSHIARRLTDESRKQGIKLRLVEFKGSKQALRTVNEGSIDLALVQGGLDPTTYPHVRQLASLHVEPLHLVVKPEIHSSVEKSLANLRGKSVNLSSLESGTHDLALEVLRFAGLKAGEGEEKPDYQLSTASYAELETRIESGDLPDAIFAVSDLPSPTVRKLVAKRRYQLVSLPFGEAFSIDSLTEGGENESRENKARPSDVSRCRIYPTVIPAFTYGMEPPTPAVPLSTFGPRLLLVAHESVPTRAARLVLEAVFSTGFAQYYQPPLDPTLLDLSPEYPLHAGTEEFREHHKPLLAGDLIDLLEKGTSLAGAIAGALFFLWQWLRQYYRRKRELGFESYMIKVAAIEQQALGLEMDAMLDLKELLRLQVELSRLKNEALTRFAEGKLEGEELISGFVTHVNDARNYLTRLILHERDNLENRAQTENRPAELLWKETLGDLPSQFHGPIDETE
jgi:TRAP-type uncharacterized transport system substrate-binding protein